MVINNFEELLCEAVKNNRRVIIPNLGAFINNSSDGAIIFSPLLTINDGFLIDELHKEGIDDSAMFLKNFVRQVIAVIENGSRFYIAGLGYFFKDESIQFIFEPSLIDPLPTEKEENIVEENIVNEEEKPVEENTAKEEEKPVPESRTVLVIISISACLLIAVSVFVLLLNLSGTTEPLTSPPETSENQFVITDNEISNSQVTPLTNLNYHVIAGCFEDKLNAENFVLQCKTLGYDKSVILSPIGILYPVSIGDFATHAEAVNKQKEYNEKYGDDAWIYQIRD
jgi:nucleoid DNA-binding protein